MLIKKKSIRSVERYTKALHNTGSIRLVFEITPENRSLATQAGFIKLPQSGDTILPTISGRTSEYNAEGKYILLKDLPKELRYITTIEWSWEQWCGQGQTETKTEYRDIYRECYQRLFLSPPALEVTWLEKGGMFYIISQEFLIQDTDPGLLKHAINLFLELFGECEIRKEDLSSFTLPSIKRVNWQILPPGKYPWDTVKNHVKQIVSRKDPRYSSIILHRQDILSKYRPDEIYAGTAGFQSYIAYTFNSRRLVILESIETGNATYVFGENWREFSMLTKAEILSNNHQQDRVIHSKGWESRIKTILAPGASLVS